MEILLLVPHFTDRETEAMISSREGTVNSVLDPMSNPTPRLSFSAHFAGPPAPRVTWSITASKFPELNRPCHRNPRTCNLWSSPSSRWARGPEECATGESHSHSYGLYKILLMIWNTRSKKNEHCSVQKAHVCENSTKLWETTESEWERM